MQLPRVLYESGDGDDSTVRTRIERGVAVVEAVEPLVMDGSNLEDLEATVIGLLNGGLPVVLDASRVEFFENPAIDTLMAFERCARDVNGDFVLSGLNDEVAGVFRICGLDCLFRIYPSVPRAVRSLARGKHLRPAT